MLEKEKATYGLNGWILDISLGISSFTGLCIHTNELFVYRIRHNLFDSFLPLI
jgi:hypothetical protein